MMTQRIFIDAMNVVRSNVSLAKIEEREGPVAASHRLLQLVCDYAKRNPDQTEWIVVYDGPSNIFSDMVKNIAVHVFFSEERTADDLIIEKAIDSVALGHATMIVTNDTDVRAEGASVKQAEDFYAELVASAPPKKPKGSIRDLEEMMIQQATENSTRTSEAGHRLLSHLIDCGHLPPSAANNGQLATRVSRELQTCSENKLPPQKCARRLEELIRKSVVVCPDPDPQKKVQRAVKDFISKESL